MFKIIKTQYLFSEPFMLTLYSVKIKNYANFLKIDFLQELLKIDCNFIETKLTATVSLQSPSKLNVYSFQYRPLFDWKMNFVPLRNSIGISDSPLNMPLI